MYWHLNLGPKGDIPDHHFTKWSLQYISYDTSESIVVAGCKKSSGWKSKDYLPEMHPGTVKASNKSRNYSIPHLCI